MLQCQQRGSHNQGGGSVDCPKQRLYVRARHERSRHPAQGATLVMVAYTSRGSCPASINRAAAARQAIVSFVLISSSKKD